VTMTVHAVERKGDDSVGHAVVHGDVCVSGQRNADAMPATRRHVNGQRRSLGYPEGVAGIRLRFVEVQLCLHREALLLLRAGSDHNNTILHLATTCNAPRKNYHPLTTTKATTATTTTTTTKTTTTTTTISPPLPQR
jgi:hypothetical protein